MPSKRHCPKHGVSLYVCMTRYGKRFSCPEPGCTVVCWGGSTSTPADQETRDKRHEAHQLFDPMWQGPNTLMSRKEAYKWLRDVMMMGQKDCHIGMFNIEQCEKVIAACKRKCLEGANA